MSKERHAELDFVRGLALCLMVLSHTTVVYALTMGVHPSQSPPVLWAIAETGSSWFFFAFGMTFDRLQARGWGSIAHRLWLFLCLAIVHNAFVRTPVMSDFFAFLWLAQVTLLILERTVHPPTWVYAATFVAAVVSMLAVPQPFWDPWARSILPGFFPLMPWILHVIAGLVYQRVRSERATWPVGAALVGVALGCAIAQPRLGWASWNFAKHFLTAPYVLLLTGLPILVLEAIRFAPAVYRRIPAVPALFEFLSRDLLLATVLHYLPLTVLFTAVHFAVPAAILRARHLSGILVTTILCLLGLVVGLRIVSTRVVTRRSPRQEEAIAFAGVLLALALWWIRSDCCDAAPMETDYRRNALALGFVVIMTRIAIGLRSADR